jgi:hypothetical protein
MPRPIKKSDLKRLQEEYTLDRYKYKTDEKLGIVVFDAWDQFYPWAYQISNQTGPDIYLLWVTKQTFNRRKKLGHPKARGKRRVMPAPEFSLDDMAQAIEIIESLEG